MMIFVYQTIREVTKITKIVVISEEIGLKVQKTMKIRNYFVELLPNLRVG